MSSEGEQDGGLTRTQVGIRHRPKFKVQLVLIRLLSYSTIPVSDIWTSQHSKH
jgi:hypothetical protein